MLVVVLLVLDEGQSTQGLDGTQISRLLGTRWRTYGMTPSSLGDQTHALRNSQVSKQRRKQIHGLARLKKQKRTAVLISYHKFK